MKRIPQKLFIHLKINMHDRTRSSQFLGDTDQFPHHALPEARLQAVGSSQVYGTSEDYFEMILQRK